MTAAPVVGPPIPEQPTHFRPSECRAAQRREETLWEDYPFELPYICTTANVTGSRPIDVLCYPFGGYSCSKMLVAFLALFVLRFVVRRWARHREQEDVRMHLRKQLQREREKRESAEKAKRKRNYTGRDLKNTPDSSTSVWHMFGSGSSSHSSSRQSLHDGLIDSPRLPSSQQEPLLPTLPVDIYPQEGMQQGEEPPPYQDLCCRRQIRNLIYWVLAAVAQVCQWWVLMLFFLVNMMAYELDAIRGRFGIDFLDEFLKVVSGHSSMKTFREKPPALTLIKEDWLVYCSLYSIAALIVCFGASIFCILLQVLMHWKEKNIQLCTNLCVCSCNGACILSSPRDTSTMVLLLPMVYALMCAKSVDNYWSIMTQNYESHIACSHWSRQDGEKLTASMADSNLALADMFEAWTLFLFGQMVALMMEGELDSYITEEVVKEFKNLLTRDVMWFTFVCLATALYQTTLVWCKLRLDFDVSQHISSVDRLQIYLVGANWMTSSIAIYTLVSFEIKFHHLQRMQEFGPRLKFWSIKLMVLVAFWSSGVMILIRDICGLSDNATNLLDASIRIYIMTGVAILNLKTWMPCSGWYKRVINEKRAAMKRRLELDLHLKNLGMIREGPPNHEGVSREGVGKKPIPHGVVAFVSRVLDVDPSTAKSWPHVKQHIDMLDSHQAYKALYRGSQFPPDLHKDHRDLELTEIRLALSVFFESLYPDASAV